MAKWYPLLPATAIRDDKRIEALIAYGRRVHDKPDEPFDEVRYRALIEGELAVPLFRNWLYQVARREIATVLPRQDGKPGNVTLVHLSIRRLDQLPARDWRDLQRIKNELLGPECEACELFPAERRLVDIANQTHLWGYDDPKLAFPFGFPSRMVDYAPDKEGTGTRQRAAS